MGKRAGALILRPGIEPIKFQESTPFPGGRSIPRRT